MNVEIKAGKTKKKSLPKHNALPSKCIASRQISSQRFAWKQEAPGVWDLGQWGRGRKPAAMSSLWEASTFRAKPGKAVAGEDPSCCWCWSVEKKRRKHHTKTHQPPTGLQNEPGNLCLPKAELAEEQAQSKKLKPSCPSTLVAGDCQAVVPPAGGSTSPQSQRRVWEAQPSLHHDGQRDRSKSSWQQWS